MWTYTYSGTHLLHEVIDPDGNVIERTHYAYDAAGRATRQENGLDEPVVEIEYLLTGERVVTDTGKVVTDTYDARHVLVGRADATSGSQAYAFDGWYNRRVVTDANGNTTYYDRTRFGYATAITDALSHATRMAYDAWNNLTAMTDTLGRTTTYEYETVTRTVNGRAIALTNLVTVTDPLSYRTGSPDLPPLMIGAFVETRIQAEPIKDVVRIDQVASRGLDLGLGRQRSVSGRSGRLQAVGHQPAEPLPARQSLSPTAIQHRRGR